MMSAGVIADYLRRLDEDTFEDWLCGFLHATRCPDTHPQRYGRRGQSQQGVDLFSRLPDGGLIGVQAKAYVATTLTKTAIDEEVRNAHAFDPPLQHYIICTLNPRDANIQAHARAATIHGYPNVEILALEDLAEQCARLPEVTADLIRRLDQGYLEALRLTFGPIFPPSTTATVYTDALPADDPQLRTITGWIDAGQPQRALEELHTFPGDLPRVTRLRLEARARFTLGEFDAVRCIARAEAERAEPNATLLAIGGHAAQLLGDTDTADTWLTRAQSCATTAEQADVVGATVRARAVRPNCRFEDLLAYAEDTLEAVDRVALALADSAFALGDIDEAVKWYARAHANQPHWSLGAEANELGAQAWQLISRHEEGELVAEPLAAVVTQLEQMANRVRASQLSQAAAPVLTNLGHVLRTLQRYSEAVTTWDEALENYDGDDSLWVHRCVLSAAEAAPLPSAKLISQCATTAASRLVLVAAYVRHGEVAQAEALLEAVESDPTATEADSTQARFLRIDLECGGLAGHVTPDHVRRVLDLYDQGVRSLPLLGWLVFNFDATSGNANLHERARIAINQLATAVDIDPARRLGLADALLRADLADVAFTWLPAIKEATLDDTGALRSVRAARILLRLYAASFHFDEMRELVAALTDCRPLDPSVTLETARVLFDAGDRHAAYAVMDAAIARGQRHSSLLLSWAQLAVMLGHRRAAHRVLGSLHVTPRSANEYADLLQARAWLGVHDHEQELLVHGAEITPETAGRVFGVTMIGRPHRVTRVDFGHVVHVQIVDGDQMTFDERVVLTEGGNLTLPSVRAIDVRVYAWAAALLGARKGESRLLAEEPFKDQVATILEIVGQEQWSVYRAAEMVRMLPHETTGVIAVRPDPEQLLENLRHQVQMGHDVRQGQLHHARENALPIAITAACLGTSPRALLWETEDWRPSGHSGNTADITADDQALTGGAQLVLDPVSVLLLVALGAEDIVTGLPQRPAITPQATALLFDWWYAHERRQRGVVGHLMSIEDHDVAFIEHGSAERREITTFWRRLKHFVETHLVILEPPPATQSEMLRMAELVGPGIVSGMALAHAHGWVYVTEEPMLRALVTSTFTAQVASVHRLVAHAAQSGGITQSRGVQLLTTLIDRGWRWISFPVYMLDTALQLPEPLCWKILATLLSRVREADPQTALQALLGLLMAIDAGRYAHRSATRLRTMICDALPPDWPNAERRTLAQHFAQRCTGAKHRASRQLLYRWARRESRS